MLLLIFFTAQSWFESQVGQSSINAEAEEPAKEIPSVAAAEFGEDAACEICRDKFEQFYNEEREEWHLRQAIKVDNKLYHPICHQDYRVSIHFSWWSAVYVNYDIF